MLRLRALIVVATTVILGASIGFAQNSASTQAPSQITSPRSVETPAPKRSLSNRIKNWSGAQWNAIKDFWSNSQQKWDACIKESQGRKMSINQRTHFMEECMRR
jgi:hypothetical protein